MAETTTTVRIEVALAPLIESYTAEGLAFAVATRAQSRRRSALAKRLQDERGWKELRG